jgi:hypothetical protein
VKGEGKFICVTYFSLKTSGFLIGWACLIDEFLVEDDSFSSLRFFEASKRD